MLVSNQEGVLEVSYIITMTRDDNYGVFRWKVLDSIYGVQAQGEHADYRIAAQNAEKAKAALTNGECPGGFCG